MAEHTRYERLYGLFLAYAALLALFGLIMDTPVNILRGLSTIILTEDALITDYVLIAGPGAALVNSALVTAISTLILRRSGEPFNGFSPVVVGLMSGFSLFGKNFVNIWPILLGTFLYAKSRREPVGKYAPVGLLATALAPVVSYIALDNGWGNPLAGGLVGILIGFIMPPLSAYTYKIQNGMNLYNVGFACGLVAFILVPLMGSMGATPTTQYHWAEGYDLAFGVALGLLCAACCIAGLFCTGRPASHLGGLPPPPPGQRPGAQRLPSDVRRRSCAAQHRDQRPDQHGFHPVQRRGSERPHCGRHPRHHGLLGLWQARLQHHSSHGRRVPGRAGDALVSQRLRGPAGLPVLHHTGPNLRLFWLAFRRAGRVSPLLRGAVHRHPGGRYESVQQRLLRRSGGHRPLPRHHRRCPPPQAHSGGPRLLRSPWSTTSPWSRRSPTPSQRRRTCDPGPSPRRILLSMPIPAEASPRRETPPPFVVFQANCSLIFDFPASIPSSRVFFLVLKHNSVLNICPLPFFFSSRHLSFFFPSFFLP